MNDDAEVWGMDDLVVPKVRADHWRSSPAQHAGCFVELQLVSGHTIRREFFSERAAVEWARIWCTFLADAELAKVGL